MKKGDRRTDKKVLRLCRDIHKRADNIEKLQPLVVRLQEVLNERYETQVIEITTQSDESDPFDNIIAAWLCLVAIEPLPARPL